MAVRSCNLYTAKLMACNRESLLCRGTVPSAEYLYKENLNERAVQTTQQCDRHGRNSGLPCLNLLLSNEHSANYLVRDTKKKEAEECKNKRRNKEGKLGKRAVSTQTTCATACVGPPSQIP